mgnify:CR=1 FL=1
MRQAKTWKRLRVIFMAGTIFFFLAGPVNLFAQRGWSEDDLKIIRRAVVDEGPHGEQPKSPPRWLKIWIKEEASQDKEIRLSLPVALIDFLILKAEAKQRFCFQKEKDDFTFLKEKKWMKSKLKLADIWRELKRMGPGYIMELMEEASFIRIWLE